MIGLLGKACEEELQKQEWKKLSAGMKVVRAAQNEMAGLGANFGYKNAKRRKLNADTA